MNDETRKGEAEIESIPDRSDRVFQEGDYWFFHTREGAKIGPFDTEGLALTATNDYVGFAIDADPKVLDSLSDE